MTEKEVYKNGVALLEEWEDVNYCEHSFKFKDEWLTDKEVVDKLNDGEKYKVLFEIAREIIRNNLSKRYVDYLMRAEFQQFWEDLGNLEPVWVRCRCCMVPHVKEGNNDLEG